MKPSLIGITKNEVQKRKDIGKTFENMEELILQLQREK